METTTGKEMGATTLFRGNTLATKCVDAYMKMTAMPFLHAALGDAVRALFAEKRACEPDPTRKGRPENIRVLLEHAGRVLESVYAQAARVPSELRAVFARTQAAAMRKFPADASARYTAVSAFAFLRFVVPALLNPKLFNMMPAHASEETARTLTLVAKIVQAVANLSEFGQKEPFMVPCNAFVTENHARMRQFLDLLAVRESWRGYFFVLALSITSLS
jgi:Ras GTPase-activating protein 1